MLLASFRRREQTRIGVIRGGKASSGLGILRNQVADGPMERG